MQYVDQQEAARQQQLQGVRASNEQYLSGLENIGRERTAAMNMYAQPPKLGTMDYVAAGLGAGLPLLGRILGGERSRTGRTLRDIGGLPQGYLRGRLGTLGDIQERQTAASLSDIEGRMGLLGKRHELTTDRLGMERQMGRERGTDLLGAIGVARDLLPAPMTEYQRGALDVQRGRLGLDRAKFERTEKLDQWEQQWQHQKWLASMAGVDPQVELQTAYRKELSKLNNEISTSAYIEDAGERQALYDEAAARLYRVFFGDQAPRGQVSDAEIESWLRQNMDNWDEVGPAMQERAIQKRRRELMGR